MAPTLRTLLGNSVFSEKEKVKAPIANRGSHDWSPGGVTDRALCDRGVTLRKPLGDREPASRQKLC